MKTYAVLKRVINRNDYEDIKFQAKVRGTPLKELAVRCGYTYKQFYRSFDGKSDNAELVEALLTLGYELKEII